MQDGYNAGSYGPETFTFNPIEPPICYKQAPRHDVISLDVRASDVAYDATDSVMRTFGSGSKQFAYSDVPTSLVPQPPSEDATIPATVSAEQSLPEITAAQSVYSGSAESIDPGVWGRSTIPPPPVILPAGNADLASRSRRRSSSGTPRKSSRSRTSDSVHTDTPRRTASRGSPTPTRELDRMHVESRAPARFICPIAGRVMRDPVILPTGTNCDRGALEEFLANNNCRDPVTKRALRKPINLVPNREMNKAITAWSKRNAPWLLDEDGMLKPKEPKKKILQGSDAQYVTPVQDANGGTEGTEAAGRDGWKFFDRSKTAGGGVNLNANAGSHMPSASSDAPWRSHRGLATPPKQYRSGSSTGRSRSNRRGASRSPSKRGNKGKVGAGALIFLLFITSVYVALFVISLWRNGWSFAPMNENPWYGPSSEGLVAVGAQVLPLMEDAGQWWRLFSSPFVPAGVIHAGLCVSGLWMHGIYASKALPMPAVSLPGVYFLAALLGALASGNLNAMYVSCGAISGVAGLLGVVCMDQMLTWPKKKLFNLKEWYLAAFLLILDIGIYVTGSLLPYVDVWCTTAGLITGLLSSFVLLTLCRVGKGRQKNAAWASGQILCALMLVAIATTASVGLALPTKLGESVSILQDASCVQFQPTWWQCTPYGYLPNGCGVTQSNATTSIICPGVASALPIDPVSTTDMGDAELLATLCMQYCASAGSNPPTPVAGEITGSPPAPPTPSSITPTLPAAPSSGGSVLTPGETPGATPGASGGGIQVIPVDLATAKAIKSGSGPGRRLRSGDKRTKD